MVLYCCIKAGKDMKRNLFSIIICMLFITTPVVSIAGSMINKNQAIQEVPNNYSDPVQQISFRERNMASWSEMAKKVAVDGESNDLFGRSVSVFGDYAVIGAYWDDTSGGVDAGSAYVFKRSGTSWTQEAKLLASDSSANDYFGLSVSLSGDYILIGAATKNMGVGAAYIFKRSGTSWTQEAKLLASDGSPNDHFGRSVSLSGDYALVGAYQYDVSGGVDAGSAYVFKRSGTSWTQEAKLLASDGSGYDYFGTSLSISGDYAIVGAYWDDTSGGINSGSAYVFKRSGTSWTQEAKLLASDGSANDYFGYSVFVSEDYAVVGAYWDDTDGVINSGSAYVFKRSGTSWTQETKLLASDGSANDHFGNSVSISGNFAIIGAQSDDTSGGVDAGSVYIFRKAMPDLLCSGDLSWTNVKPGETVEGSFIVKNVGDPGTQLDWKVTDWPSWGEWTFNPGSGIDLNPEDEDITVEVTCVVPNVKDKEFNGKVKVENLENSEDYLYLDVTITTPKNKVSNYNFPLINWLFEQFPNMFPFLKFLLGLN